MTAATAGNGESDGDRPLLVVSDRPELFRGLSVPGRPVLRWTDAAAGSRDGSDILFTGNPAAATTYRTLLSGGGEASAIVDFSDGARASSVLAALRDAAPGVAALVLCAEEPPVLPPGIVARCVPARTLLSSELGVALERLDTLRCVERLRAFAEGARLLPILIQDDPDPDAIASAYAVRVLLRRRPADCPIVTRGTLSRPENRRMIELLDLAVTAVTDAELASYERAISVDVQPPDPDAGQTRWAVIDHHPPRDGCNAEFVDIRPAVGANATILTEYLRAEDEGRIGAPVATALLYGIKTDTATLSRGVSREDAIAYAFLQERADSELLQRMERRASPPEIVRAFGRALEALRVEQDLAVAFAGKIPEHESHIVAELADFCLSTEGVRWSAGAASVNGGLVLSVRHTGGEPGAGVLAGLLADAAGGSGGGHAAMARIEIPAEAAGDLIPDNAPSSEATENLLAWLRRGLDRLSKSSRDSDKTEDPAQHPREA